MASLNLPLILLLLMFNFVVETKGDRELVEKICKQTQDYNFCTTTFDKDNRSYVFDLNGLVMLICSFTLSQTRSTSDTIPTIAGTITDPVGKTRIDLCESDYHFAILRFSEALRAAINRAYGDVIDRVRDGTNKVIECENVYRMQDPIDVSPLTVDNHNVIKLCEIIFIIINTILIPH
ncbi:Plant invertase/pectin methylesterase inhibitor superfamily protein [Euphorbia peplus]|nr:Plant invertase/pectin methylesterase inhibitor superfamily protein [Euphorbia peplus]